MPTLGPKQQPGGKEDTICTACSVGFDVRRYDRAGYHNYHNRCSTNTPAYQNLTRLSFRKLAPGTYLGETLHLNIRAEVVRILAEIRQMSICIISMKKGME